ncbi:hypothetical protein SAMN05661012_04334 [Chitinophaga sancti]|uniref:Uncharacterized protein n=1 Tax=Chitinophaga sancti TaxID=1004 RepID=A0A1K1RWM8_9BACT|nr:hypothetical protein SAMN05661012_04334 [Chitinophaga sancti]
MVVEIYNTVWVSCIGFDPTGKLICIKKIIYTLVDEREFYRN